MPRLTVTLVVATGISSILSLNQVALANAVQMILPFYLQNHSRAIRKERPNRRPNTVASKGL